MKRLTILKYPWHTGHDYELAKLPHHFLYLTSTYREWATSHRPIPSNIEWIANHSEKESDLMILHLDQWSYDEPSKRFLFLKYRDLYQGPKIVIIHGCNMVDGCSSEKMAELTKGCHVVCNSETSLKLWNLPDSCFIRHGMSPEEWPATDYSINNIIVNQAFQKRHPLVRNHAAIEAAEKRIALTWIGRDVSFSSFKAYKNFLSKSSIFFNPSHASANPRARTEAMLMGLAVVTTNSHQEDQYITNDVNGFCSNDTDELTDYLIYLQNNPEHAIRIGQAGRDTAREVFHIDNFISQWNALLANCVN